MEEFARIARWFDLDRLVRWSETYGSENVLLRLYDPASPHVENIVADFANLIQPGLEEAFRNWKYEIRPSIAGNLLFIKRLLNSFIDAKECRSITKEITALTELDPAFKGGCPADQDTVALIARQRSKDCETLEERFGFSIEPRSEPIEAPASPNPDELARDFRRIHAAALASEGNLIQLLERMAGVFVS